MGRLRWRRRTGLWLGRPKRDTARFSFLALQWWLDLWSLLGKCFESSECCEFRVWCHRFGNSRRDPWECSHSCLWYSGWLLSSTKPWSDECSPVPQRFLPPDEAQCTLLYLVHSRLDPKLASTSTPFQITSSKPTAAVCYPSYQASWDQAPTFWRGTTAPGYLLGKPRVAYWANSHSAHVCQPHIWAAHILHLNYQRN